MTKVIPSNRCGGCGLLRRSTPRNDGGKKTGLAMAGEKDEARNDGARQHAVKNSPPPCQFATTCSVSLALWLGNCASDTRFAFRSFAVVFRRPEIAGKSSLAVKNSPPPCQSATTCSVSLALWLGNCASDTRFASRSFAVVFRRPEIAGKSSLAVKNSPPGCF